MSGPALDPTCPECGNDPADESLHREGCRRVFPIGHPLERLQFGPPYVSAWESWTRAHWTELERARIAPSPSDAAPSDSRTDSGEGAS